MTTISVEPSSLLCSFSSFATRKFKSPAKITFPTVKYGTKALHACLAAAVTNDDSDKNHYSTSYGRRGLLLSATLPFVLPVHESVEFGVNAAELGAREYLIIKEEVRKVLSKGKAAGVLRLVFHDAGTFDMDDNSGGMNGSIVYELERPENAGLKKSLKIVEKAKNEVDVRQPASWADMIAVAGAEAVSVCGGPKISVQLGRLDSETPDPDGKLPQESLDASGLKKCFQRKGYSNLFTGTYKVVGHQFLPRADIVKFIWYVEDGEEGLTTERTQELVALSGAHTLGSKGFGDPTVFDNSYFKILLEKPWMSAAGMSGMIGLPSDRALTDDDECIRWIRRYADNQNMFFEDFKNAYIKLVNSGASWRKSL